MEEEGVASAAGIETTGSMISKEDVVRTDDDKAGRNFAATLVLLESIRGSGVRVEEGKAASSARVVLGAFLEKSKSTARREVGGASDKREEEGKGLSDGSAARFSSDSRARLRRPTRGG